MLKPAAHSITIRFCEAASGARRVARSAAGNEFSLLANQLLPAFMHSPAVAPVSLTGTSGTSTAPFGLTACANAPAAETPSAADTAAAIVSVRNCILPPLEGTGWDRFNARLRAPSPGTG